MAAASGDPEFLASFVDGYVIQAAAEELCQMRQAAALGDTLVLMELAHGLKGTSARMGASGVASACAALEEAAVEGGVVAAQVLDAVGIELRASHTAFGAQMTTASQAQSPSSPVRPDSGSSHQR